MQLCKLSLILYKLTWLFRFLGVLGPGLNVAWPLPSGPLDFMPEEIRLARSVRSLEGHLQRVLRHLLFTDDVEGC